MLVAVGVELDGESRPHRPDRRADVAERAAEQPAQQPVELAGGGEGAGGLAAQRHHHVVGVECRHQPRQLGGIDHGLGRQGEHGPVGRPVPGRYRLLHRGHGLGQPHRQGRGLAHRVLQAQDLDRLAGPAQPHQGVAAARLRPVQHHHEAQRPAERCQAVAVAGEARDDVRRLVDHRHDDGDARRRRHGGCRRPVRRPGRPAGLEHRRAAAHGASPAGLAAMARKARSRPALAA